MGKIKNNWLNIGIKTDIETIKNLLDLFLIVDSKELYYIKFTTNIENKEYNINHLLSAKDFKVNEVLHYTDSEGNKKPFTLCGLYFGDYQGYIEISNFEIEIINKQS